MNLAEIIEDAEQLSGGYIPPFFFVCTITNGDLGKKRGSLRIGWVCFVVFFLNISLESNNQPPHQTHSHSYVSWLCLKRINNGMHILLGNKSALFPEQSLYVESHIWC